MSENDTGEHLIQGSKEWLELRKTKITGTDAAVILGISPWKTPFTLWEQKRGIRPPDTVTPHMQRGSYLEPIALKAYETKTKVQMLPSVVISKKHSWMMGSLDGINFERDLILEIKCGEKVYAEAKKGNIPDYYISQMQHNMSCANVDMSHFLCWLPDNDGILMEVPRDNKYIENLIEKELAFYLLLKSGKPPEMTDKDCCFISDPQDPFRLIEKEWLDTKAQATIWSMKEEELRNKLIDSAKDGSCQGQYAKATKYTCKGRINYRDIPALKDVDLEQYRGEDSIQWRLSKVKENEVE